MSDRLARLLADRPYLLSDGATGTNYFDMGLQAGDAPEMWNVDHPERVADLHRRMIQAGADIILTNSFGGTRYRLKLHGAEARVVELNRRAARIAREVADTVGASLKRDIAVAGSMGPTGELFEPLGPLTVAEGASAFAEQALGLAEGGADMLWIETMSSKDELRAAVEGAGTAGLPLVTTLSFDTNGRTMMGVTPAEVARFCHELVPRPAAYGANCGTGAAELVAALVNMRAAEEPGDVIVAKSNCGVPHFQEGRIVYDGTPVLMADYARLARDAGARIIGGCCGTTPGHLAAIRNSLRGYEPGEPPTVDQVAERLGAVSAGTHRQGEGGPPEAPRRRKGRRGEKA